MTKAAQDFSMLMNVAPRPANIFTHGRGSWIYDCEGRAFLDFEQGWAVNCLGHAPKIIADALARQAQLLMAPGPAYHNARALELARLLTQATCFDQAFFGNSGAEANEGAIKLARKFGALHRGGAYEIITFADSFHGRTLATMAASGKPAFAPLFEPKPPGFPKARLNDIESVKVLTNARTVAIMIEPIQGEAGVRVADPQFLKNLRDFADENGLLLIFDEIQTGMGRTGALFDYMNCAIEPDVMTIGKGVGGGAPLSALLAKNHAACFEHGDQGGTYCGNPLMCAVGAAVLETVDQPDFLEGVRAAGAYLTRGLQILAARHGFGGVEGRGLLLALDVGRPIAANIQRRAFDAGLLVNAPRPDRLRFMPALNVAFSEIDEMLTRLERACALCA